MIMANNLPNTIIVVGPRGQGKRSVVKWLAKTIQAPVYEPADLKIDSIREINNDSRTISNPKVYLLADCEKMTPQAQNALLKLSEEPPEKAYIIMTVQDSGMLLPTILSRSIVLRMDGYTQEELKNFTTDETLISIAQNPGNIERLKNNDYETLLKHAEMVAANVGKISVANAFNILKKVDKEDYELFISMLIYTYGQMVKAGVSCEKALRVIHSTKNLLSMHTSINKQNALEMMFVTLREVSYEV